MRSMCEFADVMAREPFPPVERAGGSLPIKDSLYNLLFKELLSIALSDILRTPFRNR